MLKFAHTIYNIESTDYDYYSGAAAMKKKRKILLLNVWCGKPGVMSGDNFFAG